MQRFKICCCCCCYYCLRSIGRASERERKTERFKHESWLNQLDRKEQNGREAYREIVHACVHLSVSFPTQKVMWRENEFAVIFTIDYTVLKHSFSSMPGFSPSNDIAKGKRSDRRTCFVLKGRRQLFVKSLCPFRLIVSLLSPDAFFQLAGLTRTARRHTCACLCLDHSSYQSKEIFSNVHVTREERRKEHKSSNYLPT